MVTDDVFAVIAESTRRDILVSLRSGDKAVGELVEELAASQPTISKHLKVLREAQLVSMRAQGQKRYYALNRKPLEGIASWLETLDVGSAAPAPAAAAGAAPAAATDAKRAEPAPAQARKAAAAHKEAATAGAVAAEAVSAGVLARDGADLSPAVVIPGGTTAPLSDDSVPQQIGRTVGRAATKAADLLANLPNLPKFGRKK
ncbi:metalloregulator ArsR/SmtB family transcription factor [Pseudarthrobacter sp. CC4]|jgi:DNA-binding transcriptional ArsR family regulator|uniref:ArsR/SmtB family transcription factor n=1 Tax=unclassified Pseudarthrobacter TaxID=2647000 RepID=UPI0012F7E757|nr:MULTISPECIES: metalloregulator ArsR/SmtB family transcription factor [unclassified Pseudarthrobacter]MEA3550058.1 metalloregulator ArsR/SmtB family transcription factor [Pseudarthrobacter sp. C1]MUU72245.1 metalloregulator ArsR/SmtB family transcription factor [Pseudarthrobacter sp. GA104]HET7782047.1 metalloregulator ArsR/SmtB family transcription factor [Arthrobacter sp.]